MHQESSGSSFSIHISIKSVTYGEWKVNKTRNRYLVYEEYEPYLS